MTFTHETFAEAFVNGTLSNGAVHNAIAYEDRALKFGSVTLAYQLDDVVLLAPSKNFAEEFNDALLLSTTKAGKSFRRMADLNDLLNGEKIAAELKSGYTDRAKLATAVYGIEIPAFNVSLVVEQEKVKSEWQAATNAEMERHSAEQARINQVYEPLFGNLTQQIEKSVETIKATVNAFRTEQLIAKFGEEFAKMPERNREETIAFDEGRSYNSGYVKGAGRCGTRLRTASRTTKTGKEIVRVEGSSGYETTIGGIKAVYNGVIQYVVGLKDPAALDSYSWNRGREIRIGSVPGGAYNYGVMKSDNRELVYVGCQQVTFAEVLRFGKLMGWPLDGTKVD